MTTAELARSWGVTTEAVRRRVREGLPVATRGPRGGLLFDPEAAAAWKAQQARHTRRGRPPSRPPSRSAARPAKRGKAEVADVGVGGPPDLMGMSRAMLERVAAASPEMSGLTPGAAGRLLDLLRVQRMQMEMDRQRGDLIDRAEAEAAWAGAIHEAVARLEAIPVRLAPSIAAALGAPDRAGLARDLLDQAIRRAIEGIGALWTARAAGAGGGRG